MGHVKKLEHPLIDHMMMYEEMRQELESNCFGKWVIIGDGEIVGEYETFHKAEAAAQERGLNVANYLVTRVGVELPVILSYEK